MFTQCPKCQSVFMVSEKDIKAHEGLVRCGNCYSVFNSSWNLTDDPRNDFVEQPATPVEADTGGLKSSGSHSSSAFTFSLMDSRTADSSGDAAGQAEHVEEGEIEAHQKADISADNADVNHDADLEPFPEPDSSDFPDPAGEQPVQKKQDASLLYFDSSEEEDEAEALENAENSLTPIEDLTILQTPSLNADIKQDEEVDAETIEIDITEDSTSVTLTEESMWPGGEAEFENTDEPALPSVSDRAEDTVVTGEDDVFSLPVLSDEEPIDSEPFSSESSSDSEAGTVDNISQPVIAETELLEQADEPETPEVTDLPVAPDEVPETGVFKDTDNAEQAAVDESDSGISSDSSDMPPGDGQDQADTFPGEVTDSDEFFSLDSLPKTADEAFSLPEQNDSADESVFITSEEEDIDDAYVPISLKSDEQSELFHGLDEFPEPGELSALNYEDTMEINAMLEEANISKEQIESALTAAEIDDGEEGEDGFTEKIMLSSDAGMDLTEAVFASEEGDESSAESDRKGTGKAGRGGFFKKFIPLGMGRKKAWKEPQIGDDQTQLIRSLSREKSSPVMPLWVGKYSLYAAVGVLVVILLGQIGYFYMDKLVHIRTLKPLLEAGCMIARCTVPEIQNIAAIDQLSSRLTPLAGRDGGFKVSSILINRDIRAQAFPALELTLTDRAGNMISRRVIQPDSYLVKDQGDLLQPNEAVDISIRFRTPSIRVDGFELRPVSQNWLERTGQGD